MASSPILLNKATPCPEIACSARAASSRVLESKFIQGRVLKVWYRPIEITGERVQMREVCA